MKVSKSYKYIAMWQVSACREMLHYTPSVPIWLYSNASIILSQGFNINISSGGSLAVTRGLDLINDTAYLT